MRARLFGLTAAVVLLSTAGILRTAVSSEPPTGISSLGVLWGDGGSSGREARESARGAIPLDRLADADRRAAETVLRKPTLYRRLPVESFSCDRALLDFSLTHPEVVVDIWRVLGISRLTLESTGPRQWRMSDGYGTVGTLRLMHQERTPEGGLLVLHGSGGYSGPLSPQPLSGNCLLLVRYRGTAPADDGTPRHAMQVDAFLDANGIGLEIVTKSLHPIIVRSGAANLHEICLFMQSLSEAAADNPEGVSRLAGRLSKVDPSARQTLGVLARDIAGEGSRTDSIAAERLPGKLASRWVPAQHLEAERGR